MENKKIYVVAKIFDQQGCIAYLCKTPNEAGVCLERWRPCGRTAFKL